MPYFRTIFSLPYHSLAADFTEIHFLQDDEIEGQMQATSSNGK